MLKFLKFISLTLLLATASLATGDGRRDEIEILTSPGHNGTPVTTHMDGDIFRSAIQSAVRQLQGGISGTCAKEMVVSLKVEAKGDWKIAEIGVTGTVQIRIMNPDFPANCAR